MQQLIVVFHTCVRYVIDSISSRVYIAELLLFAALNNKQTNPPDIYVLEELCVFLQ